MERQRDFSFRFQDTSRNYWKTVSQFIQKHGQHIVLLDENQENGEELPKFYPNNPKDRTDENCYLIGFKDGHSESFLNQILSLLKPESLSMYGNHSCFICFKNNELPLKLLQNISFVDYIERDCNVSASQIQKNPPWNLDRLDKLMHPLNNEFTFERTGKGVNVYVVDSGVDERHPGKLNIPINKH